MQRERILRINKEIDSALSRRVVNKLLGLDEKDGKAPIRIMLATEGGEVDSAKRIADAILKQITVPVSVVVTETASSAALAILAAGNVRLAFKNAKMLFHPVCYGAWPDEKEGRITAAALKRIQKELERDDKDFYARCVASRESHVHRCAWTAKSLRSHVERSSKEEFTLSATQARKYGFIDAVVTNTRGLVTTEKRLLRQAGLVF